MHFQFLIKKYDQNIEIYLEDPLKANSYKNKFQK